MKTIATIVVEVDYENQYDAHGEPDMEDALREHLTENDADIFGYEWDTETDVAYVEGKLKILDIETHDVIEHPVIKPLPFCEHCGEGHEEFGCEFEVDGTTWCLNCYLSDKNDSRGYLYKYYSDMVKQAEIKYLKNKLNKLRNV